jgi:hypothetical protein
LLFKSEDGGSTFLSPDHTGIYRKLDLLIAQCCENLSSSMGRIFFKIKPKCLMMDIKKYLQRYDLAQSK